MSMFSLNYLNRICDYYFFLLMEFMEGFEFFNMWI
jgi:hypothetical protein